MGEPGRPAVPFLLRLLQDTNHDVQLRVIDVLWWLRDRRAVAPLIAAMSDPNESVAAHAAASLDNLPDARVVPALLETLCNPKMASGVRESASWALMRTRDPRAIIAFVAIAKGRDAPPSVRSAALRSLGVLGAQDAVGVVSSTLANTREDRDVRIAAAAALCDLERAGTEAMLARVARDATDDPLVRFWAAIDLVVLTDGAIDDMGVARALDVPRQVLPPDDPWAGDADASYTRLAAFHAVAEHGRTLALRSTARRSIRSMLAYNSHGYDWQSDRNLVAYALIAIYFIVTLFAWAIWYRSWLCKRQLTLQSVMVFAVVLAVGMGAPSCFDAVVPLSFDDPSWSEFLKKRDAWAGDNANLPQNGFARLCGWTKQVKAAQNGQQRDMRTGDH